STGLNIFYGRLGCFFQYGINLSDTDFKWKRNNEPCQTVSRNSLLFTSLVFHPFISIPWGASQATEYLLKLIQLKYPNFTTRVTIPQCSVRLNLSCISLVLTFGTPSGSSKISANFPPA